MPNLIYFKVDSQTKISLTFEYFFTILREEFSFVKIGQEGSAFIPTCLKAVNINNASSYKTGLEAYSVPGPYFIQDGFILCSLLNNSKDNPLEFISVPIDKKGPYIQNPLLRCKITSENCDQFYHESAIVIYIEDGVNKSYFHRSSASIWKSCPALSSESSLVYNSADGTFVDVNLQSASEQDDENDFNDLILYDKDLNEIQIETFMHFSIPKSEPTKAIQQHDPTAVKALVESFVHGLTKVGQGSVNLIKSLILERFNVWFKNPVKSKILGPIINLCQSSGSGKSKMAFELTKQGPGFFVVLRHADEFNSFPRANNLSEMLVNILSDKSSKIESFSNLGTTLIHSSKSGKCLNWLVRIIFSYFEALFEHGHDLALDYSSVDWNVIAKESYKRVQKDVNENFDLITEAKLLEYYNFTVSNSVTSFKDLTVDNVSILLLNVLNNPALILKKLKFSKPMDGFSAEVKKNLSRFPFLFVLDESIMLNSDKFKTMTDQKLPGSGNYVETTGFQVFRRLTSYLAQRTRLVILTLGTKSDVVDLNPSVHPSDRNSLLTGLLPPIILSGNTDIFDEYSLVPFDPSHASLKNPITYKELVSYGHAVWSSQPFEGIVEFAQKKLTNGSLDDYKMVPSIWMVRTGIRADSTNLFAKELVASRMATLFDVNPSLSEFAVSYPSEPILAMAARNMCDTKTLLSDMQRETFNYNEVLFTGLYNKMNTVVVDRGEYAETLAVMTLLRAIDKSPNCAKIFNDMDDYEEGLSEMINECEDLESLWKKQNYLLETEKKSSTCTEFADYHVTTVKDFLNTLLKQIITTADTTEKSPQSSKITRNKKIETEIAKMPKVTLDGIINASHFVKLSRNSDIDSEAVNPSKLPLANHLVTDKSRNVIDRSLLRLGFRRQCGFLLPDSYCGIDAIIPVCLDKKDKRNRPIYTFIGVQIKTVESVSAKDLNNMYARLHFVTCPLLNQEGHQPETCTHCEDPQALEEIFENQISIAISVDGEAKKNQLNVLKNYSTVKMPRSQVIEAIYSGKYDEVLGPKDLDKGKANYSNDEKDVLDPGKLAFYNEDKQKMIAFPSCSYSHKYRGVNLGIDLRVWKYKSSEYLKKVSTVKSLKRPRTNDTDIDKVADQTEAMEIDQEPVNTITHRMFVIECVGLDLIQELFDFGVAARQAAAKILRKAYHINNYTNDYDIERYLKAVTMDRKVSSSFHNYVTQTWRNGGNENVLPITSTENVKILVKKYKDKTEALAKIPYSDSK